MNHPLVRRKFVATFSLPGARTWDGKWGSPLVPSGRFARKLWGVRSLSFFLFRSAIALFIDFKYLCPLSFSLVFSASFFASRAVEFRSFFFVCYVYSGRCSFCRVYLHSRIFLKVMRRLYTKLCEAAKPIRMYTINLRTYMCFKNCEN